jgi:hypothetical protein
VDAVTDPQAELGGELLAGATAFDAEELGGGVLASATYVPEP